MRKTWLEADVATDFYDYTYGHRFAQVKTDVRMAYDDKYICDCHQPPYHGRTYGRISPKGF